MKSAALAILLLFAAAGAAEARGCLKGAVVGGVAGHFAHHHTLAGAAIGCVVAPLKASWNVPPVTSRSVISCFGFIATGIVPI